MVMMVMVMMMMMMVMVMVMVMMMRPAFCASLRSQNALGHVTRGILFRKLQGKGRTLPIPPRLNTGH
jgi:hypothetical protein